MVRACTNTNGRTTYTARSSAPNVRLGGGPAAASTRRLAAGGKGGGEGGAWRRRDRLHSTKAAECTCTRTVRVCASDVMRIA